jgi:hypothetical protein
MKSVLDLSIKFAHFNELFPIKIILEKMLFVLLEISEKNLTGIDELKRLFNRLYLIAYEIEIKDPELNDFLSDKNIKDWVQAINESNIDSSDLELVQILRMEVAGLLKKLFY